ncbi:MAG: ATP-dependent helicase, partial [Candidatus Jordarchaeum sp.]|uniref:ATP-dependent helicase n=1 Tax=Candidatus Jordarchaeum sp. TaxID=2823881 RepID=UPI00404B6C90
MEYTLAQKDAINFRDGNLQIVACAGSGKTDVITRRIALLISGGIKPENFIAFTFTEKAAEEMKFRVRKHLQELRPQNPEIGDMYVGTIHSFCFELLKRFKPKYRGYDVLDENKRIIFLSNYTNFFRVHLNHLGDRKYRNIETFCRSVDVVREEMINPEDLPDEFREYYENYLNLLEEQKFLDFSGMMFEAVRLLEEDSEFAEKVRRQYKYLIVDEYQDINPLQEKLIQLIAGEKGNLCVVGDDDQCIYPWRGSNVDNILTFRKRYKNVKSVPVSTNFRSSEAIIESARKLIEKNSSRLDKKIEVWPERKIHFESGDIYAVFFEDEEDEVNFVINKIEHLRGTRYFNNKGEEFSLDYRDIAIFFRSVRTSAGPYIKAFKDKGIPYIVKGGGKLFEQDEVKLAVQSLAYLGNSSFGEEEDDPELIAELYHTCFGKTGDAEGFIEKLDFLKEELGEDDFISLQELYYKVLSCIGATDFEFTETQYYNFGVLSQAISDFEAVYKTIKIKDIKYFLGYIKGYAERNYEEGGSDDPTKINAVKIMTIHRAKGLQFPVVFMPNLVKGRFPSNAKPQQWHIPPHLFDIERYEGTEEDERRLFYVAVTRSEKYLFLSGSTHLIEGVKRRKPSLFFEEFPKDYALTKPIKDPTKREKLELSKVESLKGFPTSYSELRYYDRCPYDYKLRFIYGFNPKIAIALGYGKSIHNILNIIHNKFKQKPPTKKEITKIIDENFYLRYAPEKFMERIKNSAKKIIKNYVDKFSGEFNLILETEKAFEFALGNALISGYIDLIKRLNDKGEIESIEIVDFKEHDDNELATDYEKQLKLYAIASLKALNLNPKKATVYHLDEGNTSQVDISQKELEKVEKEVKKQVENIMNRKFP